MLRTAGATGLAAVTGFVGTAGANDHDDDDPAYPSDEWFAREQTNFAKTTEEPDRQSTDPSFQKRWNEQTALNEAEYRQQRLEETEWNHQGNSCRKWTTLCTGDPYLHPAAEPIWPGDSFYGEVGEVERVAFYDSGLDRDDGGARLSGRVWAPADAAAGDDLPGVVITNGSIQATETMYCWAAQSLVAAGYVVLTYDPRGQGRSDNETPDGTEGGNFESGVFLTNQVDAVDFFRSTPADPYPHNDQERADRDAVPVVDHNPVYEFLDRDRIGIAGHSLGATGVSVVQGLSGTDFALSSENPVEVAVAWDDLSPQGEALAGRTVEPRVPTMGQSADYGLVPEPKTEPPDPKANSDGFQSWKDTGVPSFKVNVRGGGTHYEWSRVPTLPTTRWESWGNELADHYTTAWIDFWLKAPGEPGAADAETRLLAAEPWEKRMSFYYHSSRFFPSSSDDASWPIDGEAPPSWHDCENIRDSDC